MNPRRQVDMNSALFNAARKGNAEDVRQLINEGANVNVECYGGKLSLHYAASYKHVECLRILIDNGGHINAKSSWDAETVLHYAAQGGSSECLQLLIDRGADIHAKAENGWNALHFAAISGNTRCIQLLCDFGVEIDSKDDSGRTAYDIAMQYRQHDAAKLLQALSAHKANRNRQNANSLPDQHAADQPRYQTRSNCCTRCQCDACTDKENKVNNLEKDYVDLKRKMETMEERMNCFEERNSGFNGLPLVVTTMAGFDSGDMLGIDHANPQVRRIFTKHNLNVFKRHLEPNEIIDILWTKRVLTERQYQELQSLSADLTKAEYLWSLMRQKKRYLDAMRQALATTKQLGSHEVLVGLLQ